MPEPELPNFDAILDRFEADCSAPDEHLPAIGTAIRAIRERLPFATNLGETHDELDAYTLLDELVTAVGEAYPGGHCKAGCSGCCDSQTAIFDVSGAEWAAIERHVTKQWDARRFAAFKTRFKQEHGGRVRTYKALTIVRFFVPIADRYFERKPYRCPFLEAGRCSIYAARPLACRMYGAFAIRTRWYQKATIYGCGLQVNHFRQQTDLGLPSVNMVVAQSRRLTPGPLRVLPLWIARQWRLKEIV
jgi:Fe-S-cluster containining protein